MEDLELWRLRRLGSLPPTYRSVRTRTMRVYDTVSELVVQSAMRADKVVMRGGAPERAVWRFSHLSQVFSRRGSTASVASRSGPATSTSAPEVAPPSAVSSFFRRLSLLVNSPPSTLSASVPAVAEKNLPAAPPSPRSPSASPRRHSHLRQRSVSSVNGAASPLSPRSPLAQVHEEQAKADAL